jgi:hypothetical protein
LYRFLNKAGLPALHLHFADQAAFSVAQRSRSPTAEQTWNMEQCALLWES